MFCKTASVSVKLACISNFFGKGCIQNFGFSFHLAGACAFQLLFYILKQGIFGVPYTCTCGVDPVLQSGFDFQNLGLISNWQARCAFQPLFYKEYISEYLLLVPMGWRGPCSAK